ncbi:MAG TPA: hypothetical protein VK913_10900 [Erythrobacter sp.]|nr:hypothetical protein [Erythrobacter sp.]
MNSNLIMILAVFTLGAGLLYGLWSFTRAKKAQDNHEDASVAQRQRHEDVNIAPDGTPGSIDPTVSDHRGDAPKGPDPAWSQDRANDPPTPMPPRN